MNTIVCLGGIMKKYKKIKNWTPEPIKTMIQKQIELHNHLVATGVIPQPTVVETNTTRSSIYSNINMAYNGGKTKKCKWI